MIILPELIAKTSVHNYKFNRQQNIDSSRFSATLALSPSRAKGSSFLSDSRPPKGGLVFATLAIGKSLAVGLFPRTVAFSRNYGRVATTGLKCYSVRISVAQYKKKCLILELCEWMFETGPLSSMHVLRVVESGIQSTIAFWSCISPAKDWLLRELLWNYQFLKCLSRWHKWSVDT